MDYTEVIRIMQEKLDCDWTHANTILNRETNEMLDSARGDGRRITAKEHQRIVAEVHEKFIGEWATIENPIHAYLPEGMTSAQCRMVAQLIASRRSAPLYLALMVEAKRIDKDTARGYLPPVAHEDYETP